MASTAIYVSDAEAVAVVLGGSAKSPKVSRIEHLKFSPPGFDEEGNPLPAETISDMRAVELRNWVKSNRLGGKGAAVLDASHVIFRDLHLEFNDRRQIDKIIRFQVEGVIPSLPIDDLCVGYTLDDVNESGSRITVAAARRDKVRTLIEDLEFAGLKAFECDSAIAGILNLRAFNDQLSVVESPTVWLDLQDDIALLGVLDGANMVSKRAIHIPSKAAVELEEARGMHVPPPIPGVDDEPEMSSDEELSGDEESSHLPPAPVEEEDASPLAEYPEEVASVSTLINLLKIEIRRMAVSVRVSAPIARLAISGAPQSAHADLTQMAQELGYELEFVDLLGSMLPQDRAGNSKIELPESGLVAATAGVALVGLGFEGTGINYLSGDLSPASTFDYVKWPIAVALMVIVLCLAFALALTIREKSDLQGDLERISQANAIELGVIWKDLEEEGQELFTAQWPNGQTNSALISGVHRELTAQIEKFNAGDKSKYPPVYESEKILGAVMEVFAKNVSRHHGKNSQWWHNGNPRNENFALAKFSVSQKITADKTSGDVTIECYLDPKPYIVKKGPPPYDTGRVSDESILRYALKQVKIDNPAWDGVDEEQKQVALVADDVSFKSGNKVIARGKRRLSENEEVDVTIMKQTVKFELNTVSKRQAPQQ